MQYSIVDYSTLQKNIDFRLDAERYNSYLFSFEKKILSKKNHISFLDIKIVYFGSGKNLKQNTNRLGRRFLRTQDVKGVLLHQSISSYTNQVDDLITKQGDILFTRVGDVGNVSLVTDDMKGCSISDNILLLRINGINPFFLTCYFNTDSFHRYFLSHKKGTAQGLISQKNFFDILIPLFHPSFEQKIEFLVKEANNYKKNSLKYYQKAESILLSALNLSNWQPRHQLSFTRSFKDVDDADRIDAEYFQPMYDEIEGAIKSYPNGHSTIGKEFKQNKSIFKINKEKTYQYVEIGSVNVSSGEIIYLELLGGELPANAKRALKKGDVIVSKVRTYRGAITIVPQDGYVGSGAFTILHENGAINKETLQIFLKSKPLLAWSLKPNTGTSYPVIVDDDLLNLHIPLFEQNVQDEISKCVQQSNESLYKSKALLEIAKRGVEIAIEKNESSAKQWIEKQIDTIMN